MIFRKMTDRDKKYWETAAKSDIETTMEKICDGFTKKDFESVKDSMIFYLDIPLNHEDIVLDLACGIGRTCRWVSPKVNTYIGIDFIPEMIIKAREFNKEFPNAVFVMNDGKTIPLADGMFDTIYCEIAFQHMRKSIQESYVSEIYRVLKPGGKFYAQIPRLSHYKDPSYARTDEEIKQLLSKFTVKYYGDEINNNRYAPYYVIQATKGTC
jgi:ubiquinone/menaquinone biosynthesis C-methylase UbiE